jgi:hypothetical protein
VVGVISLIHVPSRSQEVTLADRKFRDAAVDRCCRAGGIDASVAKGNLVISALRAEGQNFLPPPGELELEQAPMPVMESPFHQALASQNTLQHTKPGFSPGDDLLHGNDQGRKGRS